MTATKLISVCMHCENIALLKIGSLGWIFTTTLRCSTLLQMSAFKPLSRFIFSRTYALMRASNSVSWRVDLWSNSPSDEKTDPPADSQMHLADVHGIFDE
mgnify:CR=1 FL=1